MKIEINYEIYQYLLRNLKPFETASDVLRRLLRMYSDKANGNASSARSGPLSNNESQETDQAELEAALTSREFALKRNVAERMLYILSHVHRRDPEKFNIAIGAVVGRTRKYFAHTRDELMECGHGVNPKQIPGTGYWVDTNNDTNRKREILTQVLQRLNHSDRAVRAATESLTQNLVRDRGIGTRLDEDEKFKNLM